METRVNTNNQTSYEPEADILSWEVSHKPITHAKEAGNVIIHFADDDTPVLVEILEASTFLSQATATRTRALAA
ncbi:MAG: DUF2283 domain-containing protein [Parcubacteria group bacterium]|nr:DUF2283 domain-containing protein [Parcubacteria group bacterium]